MSVTLLARHAQANFGLGTYDRLSDHGQAQARRLAEILDLRGIKIDRIVSGALERQRETADILASELGGRPVTIDPAWNEYDHMPLIVRVRPSYRKQWLMVADLARSGNPDRRLQEIIDQALLEWVAADEISGAAPLHLATSDDLEPGPRPAADIETFAAYNARIAAALEAISCEAGTSLVVSSAGTIAAAVAPLVGIPSSAWPELHRVMVNTSVTKVVRGQRGISLISFNDHGHLEGAPGVKVTYR